MSQIGHLRLVEAPPKVLEPPKPPPAPPFVAGTALPGADVADIIPAAPPPEVLDAVLDAGERAAAFASNDRELHFETDADSGRMIVQVRDLDGNVVRTIPPSEALDIMAGLRPI